MLIAKQYGDVDFLTKPVGRDTVYQTLGTRNRASSSDQSDLRPAGPKPLVLLVEPNTGTSVALQRRLPPMVAVVASSSFEQARVILRERSPALLVTNLRLGPYNGLHLVLIATAGTRSVVYTTTDFDRILALEAQRHGAFYEPGARIETALPAYVKAVLPTRDRRDVTLFDRRAVSRGGRRASDA